MNKKTLLITLGLGFVMLLTSYGIYTRSSHFGNQTVNSQAPDFSSFSDTNQKKQAFFDYLRPHIEKQNQLISQQRESLLTIANTLSDQEELTSSELKKVSTIAQQYRYTPEKFTHKELDELLSRVDTIPENLVLIQAANESGWGSSRFAREANNFFGEWCYSKGCGIVPSQRQSGKSHEVAKFDDVGESVTSYIQNLNTNPAYAELRQLRAQIRTKQQTPTAEQLAHGLNHYSERGEAYVNDILKMLKHNAKLLKAEQ